MKSYRQRITKQSDISVINKSNNTNNNGGANDHFTAELLSLKDTFTQVLNSVCLAIDQDCGKIKNDVKLRELGKIKMKYLNLNNEVNRLISEFTLLSMTTKEERTAVQETLYQCMSYLGRLHSEMEDVLQKYDDDDDDITDVVNDNGKCCNKNSPHLHSVIDGKPVIIELQKGTHSEMEYVNRLMNNVNCLSDEKKKIAFDKICSIKEKDELGAGDELKKHASRVANALEIDKYLETHSKKNEVEKVKNTVQNNRNTLSKEVAELVDISLPSVQSDEMITAQIPSVQCAEMLAPQVSFVQCDEFTVPQVAACREVTPPQVVAVQCNKFTTPLSDQPSPASPPPSSSSPAATFSSPTPAMTSQPENIEKSANKMYIPEKLLESLLAGYCKSDISETNLETEHKKEEEDSTSKVTDRSTDECQKLSTVIKHLKNNKSMEQLQNIRTSEYDQNEGLLHIYDVNGIPLTDSNGVPLNNINGKCLVKFNHLKPISTLHNQPLFDHNSLPFVNDLEQPLYDVTGGPQRLYNREGVPLTDENGCISKLVNGKYAVQLDQYNRLRSDAYGRPLYNIHGVQITKEPMRLPSNRQEPSTTAIVVCNEHPMLYNDKGFLLTNANGLPLHDSQGNLVIKKDPISGALTDSAGCPIYDSQGNVFTGLVEKTRSLLTVYDHNKYPLTGNDGRILRNARGKEMVICDNKGNPIKDCMNRLIYDSSGISSTNPNFKAYSNKQNTKKGKFIKLGISVYDFRGYPLVDSNGISLTTSDGKELIVVSDTGEMNDLTGHPVYDKFGVPLAKLDNRWTTPTGKPFRVFDSTGFPLTSEKGDDLYDINGNKLLKQDSLGRPIMTQTGSVVCDANGILATQPEFTPCQPPTTSSTVSRKVFTNKKPMIVYNKHGKPLIDPAGMGMVDSKGNDLLLFDALGLPIKDRNGDTIYDKHKIPLNCKQDEPIISMSGKPFRIYDKKGRPLTDVTGTPLNLANGMCIIKFDNAGRPMCDFKNSPLHDFNGRILQDEAANPEYSNENEPRKLTKHDGTPLLVYSGEGIPLTDSEGRVLVNTDGTHLRLSDELYPISDCNGDLIYDATGKPITEQQPRQWDYIQNSHRDIFGRLLRDVCGEPQFDRYGRPLYDLYRRRLFDVNGRPISNAYGMILATGKPETREIDLGFDPILLKSPCRLEEDRLLTDLIGGPLFDHVGFPLYNEFGKPLIDIYGRPLYDSNGQPLCDQAGAPMSELVRRTPGTPIEIKDIRRPIELTKEIAELIDSTVIRYSTPNFPNNFVPGIWTLNSESMKNENKVDLINSDKIMYWALLRITKFDDGKKIFEILEAKPMVLGKKKTTG